MLSWFTAAVLHIKFVQKLFEPVDLGFEVDQTVFNDLGLGEGGLLLVCPVAVLFDNPGQPLFSPLQVFVQGCAQFVGADEMTEGQGRVDGVKDLFEVDEESRLKTFSPC